MPTPKPERYVIWPDGTFCHISELEDFSHKSDDYRIIEIDDTFDLEKQLFPEDSNDASS